MKYNIYFDIAAITLNVLLLLNLFFRRTYPTKAGSIYKLMLWFNLLSSVCDLGSAYLISYPTLFPLSVNYAVSAGYLLFHNLTAVMFLLYIIRLVRHNRGLLLERIFWVGAVTFEVGIILTSPLTKLVFYFDEAGTYCHGPMLSVLYAVAFAFMLYALFLFIRHRHILTTYQIKTDIFFLALLFVAIVVQYFYPALLIESFFAAIAFLMMNAAMDNPEVYFYKNTYCFNQTAFNERIKDLIVGRSKFRLLAFTYDDLKLYKKQYGEDNYQKIINDTIAICQKHFDQKRFYILSSDCIAIELGAHADPWNTVEKLTGVLRRDMQFGESTVTLEPHFCELNCPGVYADETDVNDAINSMLFDVYRNTGEMLICDCTAMLKNKHREEEIIHRLHKAINNDGFDVYYQPIYQKESGGYISAESLVRLTKQTDEYVGPDEFIPIAEENGLILKIGEIVFEKVCRFIKESDIASYGIRYIEVNLSKIQLLDISTVMRLERIAARYGVSPKQINFEITETVNPSESEKATIRKNIEYLREKGFSFSLDDYGSGYSSISYLADTPFTLIKLDKSILWNAMKNKRHTIVLSSCINLVKQFGMQCVAEGVETPEMVQLLKDYGCDFFQGYHYSKPIPEKEMLEFVRRTA